MSFLDEHLDRFGPEASYNVSSTEAQAYCAQLTATHYENFSVVTWLTPRPLRPAFQAIYAFCRWSDDLGDEVGDCERSTELLDWWREELRNLFAGAPKHPVMVALKPVAQEYGIPIDPFEALISAFEQDQVVTEYQTYAQLLDYCKRSANPVGHLVLYLGRCFDPDNARFSDLTCTALQLANFWQDVDRDLDIGRIYLPREDRDRFGYSESDLQGRRFTQDFRALMAFQVDRTRSMFLEGWPLVTRMPRDLAIDVDLFTRGGLAILDRIERQGFDVWSSRPSVGKLAKLGLLGRALLAKSKKSPPSPGVPTRSASNRPAEPRTLEATSVRREARS